MKQIIILSFAALMMCSCGRQTQTQSQMDKQNAVVETLMARRSIRAYKPEPVEREVMQQIVECGIHAPSGMNRQPWEIRIVSDAGFLDELTRLYLEDFDQSDPHYPANDPNFRNMFRNAPTVAFIAIQPGMCSQVDCGLLAGNMVNTAWAYGVGSCIQMAPIEFLNSAKAGPLMEKLEFSDGYRMHLVIGFGYADEQPEAKPRNMDKVRFVD